jgi:hypothetical protein
MRRAGAALITASVVLLLAACDSGPSQKSGNAGSAAADTSLAREPLQVGHWRVRVSVEPHRIGSIAFAVTNVSYNGPSSSDFSIKHDLVFRNTGDRAITFDDTRSSMFLGEGPRKRLLAADEGCGYVLNSPQGVAHAGACRAYRDLLTVGAHKSAARSIHVSNGAPGMDRLVPGTYVFRRPVHFQPGNRPPDENEGRSGIVRLIYHVARSPDHRRDAIL